MCVHRAARPIFQLTCVDSAKRVCFANHRLRFSNSSVVVIADRRRKWRREPSCAKVAQHLPTGFPSGPLSGGSGIPTPRESSLPFSGGCRISGVTPIGRRRSPQLTGIISSVFCSDPQARYWCAPLCRFLLQPLHWFTALVSVTLSTTYTQHVSDRQDRTPATVLLSWTAV